MSTILIADASKPSLVMTSEVFKDKIPGSIVLVAKTGKDALEILKDQIPDLCVVDFDLPDVDGPGLIEAMRKIYDGPILMTAFPDDTVSKAVSDHLFACDDASRWLPKPINVQDLSEKIERFLIEKHRLEKRFDSTFVTQLVGKAAGRGKRAPKVKGKVVNISIGGACVELDGSMKMKKSQEFMLTINLPDGKPKKAAANKKKKTKKAATKKARSRKALTTQSKGTEAKLKAKVAWIHDGMVGLEFSKLTDIQKKSLVSVLKYASVDH